MSYHHPKSPFAVDIFRNWREDVKRRMRITRQRSGYELWWNSMLIGPVGFEEIYDVTITLRSIQIAQGQVCIGVFRAINETL